MPDLLRRWADASRERAQAARARVPEGELERRLGAAAVPRPLELSARGFDVIAEIKPASPAEGRLVASEDEAVDRARAIVGAAPCALSVLTQPTAFCGSLRLLETLSALPVPVMRKDVLVDPYQVLEARAHGASGILLILRVLDDASAAAMAALAGSLGMFVLLEAFDATELRRAGRLVDRGPTRALVGVNTRDLDTLRIDRGRLGALRCFAPERATLVAESGIARPADAAEAAALGYRAALVGTSVMRAADPGAHVEALIRAGRAAAPSQGATR